MATLEIFNCWQSFHKWEYRTWCWCKRSFHRSAQVSQVFVQWDPLNFQHGQNQFGLWDSHSFHRICWEQEEFDGSKVQVPGRCMNLLQPGINCRIKSWACDTKRNFNGFFSMPEQTHLFQYHVHLRKTEKVIVIVSIHGGTEKGNRQKSTTREHVILARISREEIFSRFLYCDKEKESEKSSHMLFPKYSPHMHICWSTRKVEAMTRGFFVFKAFLMGIMSCGITGKILSLPALSKSWTA